MSSFLCRSLGLSGTFHWWTPDGSVTARNLDQTPGRLHLICHTAIVTLCTSKSASLQSQWSTTAKTREWGWCVVNRDAKRSVAANSDNKTWPHTRHVQRRITVSSECMCEFSERGVYHANLRSSITCCDGNYNSPDHQFTPLCYTHYDIILIT
jgi:hypothetical protein